MIGRQFGRLTVLRDTGKRTPTRNIIWLCTCRCGNKTNVRGTHLTSGTTKSCGCLKKEMVIKLIKKNIMHGNSGTRLYTIWIGMKARCYLKTNADYKYYGARGIKVCLSWRYDFLNFKIWALSYGYQNNLTIDRKKSDGNYSPHNCQWLTKSENSKKRERDRRLYIENIKIIKNEI
jgi:hypothetical protein